VGEDRGAFADKSPGPQRKDDRRVLSGIMHVQKVGCRWKDCPPEYGPHKTVYNRFARWSERGIWQNIFAAVAAPVESPGQVALDSSHVKIHRCASGGKRMARPVGKWLFQMAQAVCTNVSGLAAMPLAKMEIRALRSS
jgi:transposase